jgi:hypothetical protein
MAEDPILSRGRTREKVQGAPVEVLRVKLRFSMDLAQTVTTYVVFPLVALLLGFFLFRTSSVKDQGFFFLSYFSLMAMMVLVLRWLARRTVLVGADGILIKSLGLRRFIPYAQIRDIQHVLPIYGHLDATGYYCVQVKLTRGETLNLPTWGEIDPKRTRSLASLKKDLVGANLALTITEARDAWAAGQADLGLHEDVLARNGRSGAEWVAELHSLSAGTPNAYRSVTIDAERLWRLLEHPCAQPSSRIAAAVVLGAANDKSARRMLRVAARAMVDPELKKAIERAAGARDDDALIEALEAVEGHDHKAVGKTVN